MTAELPDLSAAECKYCNTVGKIRIEWRERFVPKPMGTWSLAGQQMKMTGTMVNWPYAICDACGHESEGKR